jgi:hypothetical protein
MRDGRQRHGHVLVFLVMNAMEGCRRFLRGLVHSVPEMPIGTSGVPEAPSGILRIPKHLAKIVPEGPSGTPEETIGSSGTVCTRPRRNLRQPSNE